MGLTLGAPPLISCRVSTSRSALRLSFGLSLPCDRSRSALVVLLHCDGFLHSQATGLLHPDVSHGVHCVSDLRIPSSDSRLNASPSGRDLGDLPQQRTPPFGDFPSPIAAPHHCDRCLLVVYTQRRTLLFPPSEDGMKRNARGDFHPRSKAPGLGHRTRQHPFGPLSPWLKHLPTNTVRCRYSSAFALGGSTTRLYSIDESVAPFHRCQ